MTIDSLLSQLRLMLGIERASPVAAYVLRAGRKH